MTILSGILWNRFICKRINNPVTHFLGREFTLSFMVWHSYLSCAREKFVPGILWGNILRCWKRSLEMNIRESIEIVWKHEIHAGLALTSSSWTLTTKKWSFFFFPQIGQKDLILFLNFKDIYYWQTVELVAQTGAENGAGKGENRERRDKRGIQASRTIYWRKTLMFYQT